jgi:DNA-binding response OmpR family regulator
LNHASILIVDDDEMIVHFFQMILEEMGYEISTAYTGEEAIENIKKQMIDLAILDYKLSDMKGDTLAIKLKEINNQLNIVFITGYSEIKEKILRSNLSKFVVVKPIKDEELLETVEIALNEKQIEMKV